MKWKHFILLVHDSPLFTKSLFFFRLVWIYYIIQLQFKRGFEPQFMWVMFVKQQWSIPSNPCKKSGTYLFKSPKKARNHQIFYFLDDIYSKGASLYYVSTFFDPPTLCNSINSTKRQQQFPLFWLHPPNYFTDVILGYSLCKRSLCDVHTN